MSASTTKSSGSKIGPQSDFREVHVLDQVTHKDKKNNVLKIGTWNTRGLRREGKIENLILEMKRLSMEIVGISEIKWNDQGDYWLDNHRVIYSGDEEGIAGVGVVLNKEWGRRVQSIVLLSSRVILVKLFFNDKQNIAIVQAYLPTSGHCEEHVDQVYDQIDEALELVNSKDILIILGDWNASVGEGKVHGITGDYGYGRKNDRGQRLIDYCNGRGFIITNTLFQQPMSRRYTWTKPGRKEKYQIDYIITRRNQQKNVLQSKTYPGADINSDHNLLFMKMRLQGRKQFKPPNKKQQLNLSKLQEPDTKKKFQESVKTIVHNIETNHIPTDINGKWVLLKEAIINAANNTIEKNKETPRKPWITEEVIALIEERRRYKNCQDIEGRIKYKYYKNLVNREAKKAKENWLQNLCEEIEFLLGNGKLEKAYNLIKKYFGKRRMMGNSIEDENKKLLVDDNEIVNRWKTYIEKLYRDEDELNDLDEENQPELAENKTKMLIA
ncbi:craniofacial development protein 2-like [Diaphorina citri]|uniref:Craniofacial development protein 2-like n=1 Tax=Diaphorina citri TaxID=121845 RepID=A0A3Q0IY84_DIACI|nr:craniofacial development protein 2-like [Diaphorina citri]